VFSYDEMFFNYRIKWEDTVREKHCFLVRMRYSAFIGEKALRVNKFLNQYIESEGYHVIWRDARRMLAQSIALRYSVPLEKIDIVQFGYMHVLKASRQKCIESKFRDKKQMRQIITLRQRARRFHQRSLPLGTNST
jgi:hypothetical protein